MKNGINADRVTPAFLMTAADPVAQVVTGIETQLLCNVARIFTANPDDALMPSMQWQAKKLAQLGALKKENIAVIQAALGDESASTQLAITQTLNRAVGLIEPELAQGAANGLLTGKPPPMDAAISAQVEAYTRQAVDRLNLVNTAMLNSSLSAAQKVCANTSVYERQLEHAQNILNETAGEVVTGVSSRQQAVRKAVAQLAQDGLTGFTDRAGRKWSPEAYVNMDIRTTAKNTATQAVFDRCDGYGCSLVEISSHAGARPLCEPYQGKLYDRNGGTGYVEDVNGNLIQYTSFGSTSYGQPAGLLGINCGHFAYPFVPGLSAMTYAPTQDKAQNDEEYKLLQHQRQLERNVRNAKREATMMQAMGDKEGFEQAAVKVKHASTVLNDYISTNNLSKHSDRTQVLTYNKSISGKVQLVNEKYSAYHYHKDGTIVVTDDWKGVDHPKTPIRFKPFAIIETVSGTNNQIDRTYYDAIGQISKQMHSRGHKLWKNPSYGNGGAHMHDYVDGIRVKYETKKDGRELLPNEIIESGDIIDKSRN